MATDVTAFTQLARKEFMLGMIDAQNSVMPASYDSFVTKISSSVRIETHTYMSALPRLARRRGTGTGTGTARALPARARRAFSRAAASAAASPVYAGPLASVTSA